MTRTRIVALTTLLVAMGCAHKQSDKAQAPTQPVAQAAPPAAPATPSQPSGCSRDLDCMALVGDRRRKLQSENSCR